MSSLDGASIPAELACAICLGLLEGPEESLCCEQYAHDDSHVPCQPDARMTTPQQERWSHLTKREPSTSVAKGGHITAPTTLMWGAGHSAVRDVEVTWDHGKRGRASHEEPWFQPNTRAKPTARERWDGRHGSD